MSETRGLFAADADRRMRLLEMAAGDLDKAIKLDCWVRCGVTDPNAMVAPVEAPPTAKAYGIMDNVRIVVAEPDLSIPTHLDRHASLSGVVYE